MIHTIAVPHIKGKGLAKYMLLNGVLLFMLFLSIVSAQAQTVDLATTSDTGITSGGVASTDKITSDTTPDIVITGYSSGDSITVTATHATASDVTATITGNGTVTLGTLAEGVWSITADAGGTSSNTLEITVLAELVSTMGQSDDGGVVQIGRHSGTETRKVAQKFTTGRAGYTVKEIHFDVATAYNDGGNNQNIELEIMTANGDNPGSRVGGILNGFTESSVTVGDYKYEIPSNKWVTLAPNTEYFLVFQIKFLAISTFSLQQTASNAETGLPEWSMEDACRTTVVLSQSHLFGSAGTWGNCASDATVKLGLYGNTNPSVFLKASSDTGSSNIDNITNDVTPTFTVSGLDDNELVTVTATQAGETTAIRARSGNGDITLPTLANGVWRVRAGDGTTTTPYISVTIDRTSPTAITSVSSIGTVADTTPDVTFTAPEAGVLVANSACGITAEAVTSGTNTITLTALTNGTYASCTIQMADVAGNTSPTATIPSFTITGPAIDLKSASDTGTSDTDNITNDVTPTFTVSGLDDNATVRLAASQSGETNVTGSRTGNGDVTLGTLVEGVWSVAATDGTTVITLDITVDTTAPTAITSISSIPTGTDTTPDLTFTASEAGVLVANTACGITAEAVTTGSSTITLTALAPGTYASCTIQMADVAGNVSPTATIPSFTITSGSTIDFKSSDTGSSNTDSITRDNTPTFTVAGLDANATVTVTASKSGETDVTNTRTGNGDVTLPTLADGVWSVSASDGTTTTPSISVTIDRTRPTAITGISSIGTTSDTTPDLTFTVPEAGTLVSNSACGIPRQAVTSGSNTITLTALTPGTYRSCGIDMTDIAGNASPVATIPSFTITALRIDLKASSDSGSSDTDNITNDNTPTFTVSGLDDSATVTVTASKSGETDVTNTRTGNGDVTLGTLADGVWSVSASDGTTTTPSISVTINYSGAPARIAGISSIGTTGDTTPDLTFTTAEAGTLVANSACGITAQTVTLGENTITLTALALGTYSTCQITMTNVAGNASVPADIPSFTIENIEITLKASSNTGVSDSDQYTNDNTPTFTVSGTTSGASITVTLTPLQVTGVTTAVTLTGTGNGDVTATTALADGTWGYKVTDGTLTSTNRGIVIDTVAPTIVYASTFLFTGPLGISDSVINKAEFEATAVAILINSTGSESVISFGYTPVASSTTCDNSLTYATAIPQTDDITSDGTWKICVKATDRAGNSQYLTSPTFSRDITVPVISSVSSIPTSIETTPDLTFTASEAGTLVVNSACGIPREAVTSGSKTITLTALTPGTYGSCTIQMTDSAGNTGTAISIPSFTITEPTVDLKASSDSGDSDTDNVTNDNTPTITVSNYASNASVTVTASKSGETDVTNTGTGNGDVTLPTLAEGVWTVSASDGTTTSNEIEITIDTVAPTKPSVPQFAPASHDTGISNSDNITKNTRPSFVSGHNESVFAEYTLDSTVFLGTVRGAYGFRPASALADGAYSISVKSVDLAGNKSPASNTRIFTVDTTAPVISAVSSIGTTIDTTPDLTFTASEPGVLVANSGCGITAQAVTSESNTITLTELGIATYGSCTIQMTDSAGNTGTAVSITSFTIQTGPKVDLLTAYDNGTSNTDNITNTEHPAFAVSGFASNVRVKVTATHTDGTVITITMPNDGDAESISLHAFADGVWTVIAEIPDGSVTSPPITVTIDRTAPVKPATPTLAQTSDSGVSDTDDITKITNPVVGTTTTGEGYVYEWTVNGTVLTGSTTFHTNTGVLSEGLSGVFVKVTDVAGNQSVASDVYTFTVDTTAPTAITNVGSIGTTVDTTPDLTFTAPEAGVLVANSGCGITAATVASGANTITLTALTPGTYGSCTIQMSDVAGNTSPTASIPSFTIETGGIAIAALATSHAPSREATATVTGSSPSGLNWALFDPGATPAETCGSGLTFTSTYVSETAVTIASAEADNGKKACFRATVSGTTIYQETDTITGIDTTNPSALLTLQTQMGSGSKTAFTTATSNIFFKVGDKFILTDASTDAGSGIDTSTRDLTLTRGTQQQHTDGSATTETATASAGAWTYTVGAGDNGILKYDYSISDRAGNSGSAELTITNLFVDTTAPTAPVIDLDDESDSGSSNADNNTNDTTPSFTIENPTAQITGSAINNEAGKSEEVIEWHMTAAGSSTFTKQTGSATTFTPGTALSDGVYKIKALFKDKAGNTTESTVITFTIDTTAPAKPPVPGFFFGDTGISDTDNITNNDRGIIIRVTTSEPFPASKAEWTLNSEVQPVIGSSYVPLTPLSDGVYTISVKITDAAGNQSPASDDFTFTIDTTPPTAPSNTPFDVFGDTTPDITFEASTGTNDIGAYKVHVITNTTLTDKTCPAKTVTTDTLAAFANTVTSSDASVTFTPGTALTEGKYCVYIEQSDVAGNRVITLGKAIYIDTTPIDVSGIVVDLLDAFDSTRPEVTEDGESDSDGVWTPGKTDDYTKESTISVEVSNIPVETIMGERRKFSVLDIHSGTFFVIETPTTDTFSQTFTGLTLTGHATVSYKAKNNARYISFTDVAGNISRLRYDLEADTETKTPNTPNLAATSDSGALDTDNYTNAEYLDIAVEDDDGDTNREYPTIVRLYTWVDTATNAGVVDASELTPVQVEASPSDTTDNLAATPYLLKGSSAGADVTFQNVVLPEGTHLLVAGQIDKAGNDEAYSPALTITVDRTAPDAPGAPDLHQDDDSRGVHANSARDGTDEDDITNNTTELDFAVQASGTSGAHDQHQIRFYLWTKADAADTSVGDSELTELKSVAVDAASNIQTISDAGYVANGERGATKQLYTSTDTALTDGFHYFVAKQYDVAGNLSAVSDALRIFVDTQAPDPITVDPTLHPTSDSGASNNDKQTSSADLLFTFNPTPMSGDIDYFEVRRKRLNSDLSDAETTFTYPSDADTVEQTSYEFLAKNAAQSALVAEAGNTYADGAYASGGAVKISAMDISHFNTWYAFSIYAVDIAGNVRQGSNSTNVRILVPPPTPTKMDLSDTKDSGALDTDNTTNETSWTLSGSYQNTSQAEQDNDAAAGVKRIVVSVSKLDSQNQATETLTHTFTTDTDQNLTNDIAVPSNANDPYTYTYTFDATTFSTLEDGAYLVTAAAYNSAGETGGQSASLTITLDRTAPTPEEHITLRTKAFTGSTNQEYIFSYANPSNNEPNASIVLADADGATVRTLDSTNPTYTHVTANAITEYTATYIDAAGNSSEAVTLLAVSLPPTLTSYTTATNSYIVIAAPQQGATIATTTQYNAQSSNLCDPTGSRISAATFTTNEIKTSVTTDYCVEAVDSAGNVRTIRIKADANDLIANAAVHDEDDAGSSQHDNKTNIPNPRYTATTLPGSTVRIQSRIQASPANTWTDIHTVTADADTGMFTIQTILPDPVTADAVVELQGFVSNATLGTSAIGPITLSPVTLDVTAPQAPSAPDLAAGDDTGSVNSDAVTSTTTNLTFAYTGLSAENGGFVRMYAGSTLLGETVIASGSASVSITLAEGVHTLVAKLIDEAGNEGPASPPLTVTIDTTDPAITIIRLNDEDTTIDVNTRFIAVAADQTTLIFKVVEETKAACTARTIDANTAYTSGALHNPSDSSTNGYCFVVTDLAGNRATMHTDDAIEGVGSFAIQGGTNESGTLYTTSGTKTITGITAPEAKVLIKLADATDDPSTYTTGNLQDTSFATISFAIPTGETTFEQSLSIGSGDTGKKVVGWIWTDATDATTATPAITLGTLTVDDIAPTITAGVIASNNTNPAFAKQGDTITASFTTSEAIIAETTTINGIPASCSDTNNTFSCAATLTNVATEGPATVEIAVTDKAGNTTNRTITNPDITVDAMAPAVTITNLRTKHLATTGTQTFTLTITDTNQINPGTYVFTATGATLSTCQIVVPATSNNEQTTCTITTSSATDGTAVSLTVPTLTDASGNTKASHQTTLGYVDTQAPTITSITSFDDSRTKKFSFTVAVTHNQHTSNTNPETLTAVFSGDCSRFEAETDAWTGTTTGTYTTTFSAPKGTYKTCTLALRDEAGNTSATQTFDQFTVKGGGGIGRIGDVARNAISSLFDVFDEAEQTTPTVPPTTPVFDIGQQGQQEQILFTRDLTIGSVGEDVKALQKMLNTLGFIVSTTGAGSPGAESTYFGEKTRQALIRYQEANSITPAFGYFGPRTRAHIQGQAQGQPTAEEVRSFVDTAAEEEEQQPTPTVSTVAEEAPFAGFTRDLTIGSTGEDVRALQSMLNTLGFIVSTTGAGSPGAESVYFGEKTRQALIRYQEANSITPALGYFGPRTRAHIQAQGQLQPTASVEEVRSSIETAEQEQRREEEERREQQSSPEQQQQAQPTQQQEEDATDYEPITNPLFRVRTLPSHGAPSF